MPRAMMMDLEDAVSAIGKGLVNLANKRDFADRLFPYPGWGMHQYSFEKPTIVSRWDGIAEDKATERQGIIVPSAMRFEVRILHPSDNGPRGVQDYYLHAQNQIAFGTSKFFSAMAKNRDMTELVLDVGVESSVIGDLIDPTTNERFYGHEMVMFVKVWR
jgi:hypothetical protein